MISFFNSDNCDGDNFYYATKEEDKFNNMGILRVDVRSDYEQEDVRHARI